MLARIYLPAIMCKSGHIVLRAEEEAAQASNTGIMAMFARVGSIFKMFEFAATCKTLAVGVPQ